MMIMTFVFEQVIYRIEGAMGFHCNRETMKTDDKKKVYLRITD